MSDFKAIAKRYGSFEIDEFLSLTEAVDFIDGGNDVGEHYGIGIYDEQSNSAWLPESTAVQINHDDHLSLIKEALNLPQDLEFKSVKYLERQDES
jgi:hypothetical protein